MTYGEVGYGESAYSEPTGIAPFTNLYGAGVLTAHRVYDSAVLAETGLAGYWKFEEASGATTAADSSTAGHPFAIQGAITLGSPGLLPDSTRSFDFSGGRVAATNNAWMNVGSCTVELTFQADAAGGGVLANKEWRLWQAGGYLFASLDGGLLLKSTKRMQTGKTYHAALVMSGLSPCTASLYLDGQLEATGSGGRSFVATDFQFGASFDGRIDNASYYTTALTGTQVAAHYGATGLTPEPTYTGQTSYDDEVFSEAALAAFFRFEETSGSALDSTLNLRHFGVTGAVTQHVGGLYGSSSFGYDFAGGRVFAGNNAWMNVGAFTYEAWIQPDTLNVGTIGAKEWSLAIVGDKLKATFPTGSLTGTTTLLAGRTYHVAVTISNTSGGTASVYLNGALEGSATCSLGFVAVDFNIGNGFDGRIDGVAYHTSALSASRISTHYSAGAPFLGTATFTGTGAITASSGATVTGGGGLTGSGALVAASADTVASTSVALSSEGSLAAAGSVPLSVYETAVLARTPSLYLRFDETSGVYADHSGNARDAEYLAGTRGVPGVLFQDSNRAFEPGASGGARVTHGAWMHQPTFTLHFVVQVGSVDSNQYLLDGKELQVLLNPQSGGLSIEFNTPGPGTVNSIETNTLPLLEGNTYTIACVTGVGFQQIWVNGQAVAEYNLPTPLDWSGVFRDWYLGSAVPPSVDDIYGQSNLSFLGVLDDTSFHPGALTPTQINTLFIAATTTPPVLADTNLAGAGTLAVQGSARATARVKLTGTGTRTATGKPGITSATGAVAGSNRLRVRALRPGQRWILFDPDTDEVFTFRDNPNKMTSPLGPRSLTIYPTPPLYNPAVEARGGMARVIEGNREPYEWSFSGKIRHQIDHDDLMYWSRKLNRLLLTDHLGRTWKVRVLHFDPVELHPTARIDWRFTYDMKLLNYGAIE